MNCKIPFTKDIDFEKKVSEITSISLEHEIKVEEGLLKGNFIVSGDFKSHEVSVNKEAFSYILPFEIDLAQNVDEESIEFMIEDFTYEVVDNTILRVNIDFSVIATLKEVKQIEEEPLFQEVEEAFLEFEEKGETEEEIREDNSEESSVVVEDAVIDNLKVEENEYATYHIHMVSDGENVETICTMYNSNLNVLQDYNDLSNITTKDKLIIPESNE